MHYLPPPSPVGRSPNTESPVASLEGKRGSCCDLSARALSFPSSAVVERDGRARWKERRREEGKELSMGFSALSPPSFSCVCPTQHYYYDHSTTLCDSPAWQTDRCAGHEKGIGRTKTFWASCPFSTEVVVGSNESRNAHSISHFFSENGELLIARHFTGQEEGGMEEQRDLLSEVCVRVEASI